jgi:hypothetical protein
MLESASLVCYRPERGRCEGPFEIPDGTELIEVLANREAWIAAVDQPEIPAISPSAPEESII